MLDELRQSKTENQIIGDLILRGYVFFSFLEIKMTYFFSHFSLQNRTESTPLIFMIIFLLEAGGEIFELFFIFII